MRDRFLDLAGQYAGFTILLSAEYPLESRAGEYEEPDLHIRVDEAMLGLARATFASGGRLVYGGEAEVALFLADVASEYTRPLPAEGQGLSSEGPAENRPALFRAYLFSPGLEEQLSLMEQAGFAQVHRAGDDTREVAERMIRSNRPGALVCIGGVGDPFFVEGIFRELQPGSPVYALETTGGAARDLAEQQRENLRVPDREILRRLDQLEDEEYAGEDQRTFPELAIPPYPVIMQQIVEELTGGRNRTRL